MVSANLGFKQPLNHKFWRAIKRQPRLETPLSNLPESWQCIVHLKLLRAFARLRARVVEALLRSSSFQSTRITSAESEQTTTSEDSMRERVWQVYLEHASCRFEAWWKSIAPKDERGWLYQVNASICLEPGKLEAMLRDTKPMTWTEKNLPPLDVLMVLHSFMLNPRCFLEDCIRFGLLPLWKAGMPWRLIDKVIQTSTDEYLVPSSACKLWEKTTGRAWKIDLDHLETTMTCPGCDKVITSRSALQTSNNTSQDNDGINHQTGTRCESCNFTFTNDHLQVYKFRRAIEDLQQRNTPISGTILNMHGLARSASAADTEPEMFTLNKLTKGETGAQILAITTSEKLRDGGGWPSIKDLYHLINNNAIECSNDQHLKTATRRAISHVTDNHSIFTLDLAAAVFRQCVFIDKMEEIDWLHSPALQYTIDELIERYKLFFEIMGQNKNNVAVPTYAVDLAWHTHQSCPSSYYAYSVVHADNIFIDHDDRIEEGVRTDAFDWTKEQYTQLTGGGDYSQCLCWHCAAAREELNDKPEVLVMEEHGHVDVGKHPELNKRIRDRVAKSQYLKLEEDFAVACRLAKIRDQPLPDQKEYLKTYTWLYPQAIPLIQ